jgi:hypothetical protein
MIYPIRPLLPANGGTFYPPISNFWVNECQQEDAYQIVEATPDDPIPPEVLPSEYLSLPSDTRFFTGTHQKADFSSEPVLGYLDRQRLFHIIVGSDDADRRYVGVYSDTRTDPQNAARLVLFPETFAGRQLVLLVCPSNSAATAATCPGIDNEILELEPGPTACAAP